MDSDIEFGWDDKGRLTAHLTIVVEPYEMQVALEMLGEIVANMLKEEE